MPTTDPIPHTGVYRPHSFVCGSGVGGCLTTYSQRPERQIAGMLLEEIGDWIAALRGLPPTAEIPPGVLAAGEQFHEAVARWTELVDRREARRDR